MADKTISELIEATSIGASDLLVLEQNNTAKKLTGQTMINYLTAAADGHGGISGIALTSTVGLTKTYTITYADESTSTFQVSDGAKGDKGNTGATGATGADLTLSDCSVMYASSSSGTTTPGGTWTSTVPAVQQGYYLWTRVINTYSDGSVASWYSVARMGLDGSGAVSSVNNISPDANYNVEITASDIDTTGGNSVQEAIDSIANIVYPVGSIYMSVNSTSPASLFGGTWERIQDTFLLAAGSTYSPGATGGEAYHQLVTSEIPAHTHGAISGTETTLRLKTLNQGSAIMDVLDGPTSIATYYASGGGSIGCINVGGGSAKDTSRVVINVDHEHDSVGGGNAHNNMPPYLSVYMWKRTA